RWYFQSAAGLFRQNGRQPRAGQGVRSMSAIDGIDGDTQSEVALDGFDGNSRTIGVDPAVLDENHNIVRPARIFVYRNPGPRCPVAGESCYEVYEDMAPLPETPPPPDEATVDKPEGPGLTGVYDGVASAYGARLRLMRGLSSAWPAAVPGLGGGLAQSLENPPQDSTDYKTDPFFYFAGACGSSDRELTFGKIRQSTLHGDLSSKDAIAGALAVDPDVMYPSAPTDTTTRQDVADPGDCAVGMLRTMSNPAPGGADNSDPSASPT